MLETVIPGSYRRRFKISENQKGGKLGKCLLCGERVRTNQNYLTTSEGYAHKNCIRKWKAN